MHKQISRFSLLVIWTVLLGLGIHTTVSGETAVQAKSAAIENNLETAVFTGWDDRFYQPGPNNGVCIPYCVPQVNVVAIDGSDVYVGGSFTYVDSLTAHNIAKWDGSSWSTLGGGVTGLVDPFIIEDITGIVSAIVVNGNDVYIAGRFPKAGNITVNNIAKWNGTSWSALGSGMNGSVNALVFKDDKLYAGGYFTEASGNTVNYIAQWNGTDWTALDAGMDGPVSDIVIAGSDLYAGGNFAQAGASAANNIAKWNGSNWQAMGSGIVGSVEAVAVNGSNIYIGGSFSGGNIAMWDETTTAWLPLGTGVDDTILNIVPVGTDLYVAGAFSTSGSNPPGATTGLARWDGSDWFSVTYINYARALAYSNGDLYVGGGSILVPENGWATGIAKWNGSAWSALDSGTAKGLGRASSALALAGNDVLVGGLFTQAGQTSVDKIARWNGADWSSLGAGADAFSDVGKIETIAVDGENIYAGGKFTSIGGVAVNNIAHWDGNQWSSMNGGACVDTCGYSGDIYALEVVDGALYAAGYFNTIGGVASDGLAKWDGSQWIDISANLSPSAIYDLAIVGDDFYIAGNLSLDGGNISDHIYIAQWNGSAWQEMGDGFNDEVYALEIHNGELYAGGRFIMSGSTAINRVARWDGEAWQPLGAGVGILENDKVLTLASHGKLYAGGTFLSAEGQAVRHLAAWDGTQWESVYGGIHTINSFAFVDEILFRGNDMFVAGRFSIAGDKSSSFFARLIGSPLENLYLPFIANP